MAGTLTGSIGISVTAELVKTTGSVTARGPLAVNKRIGFDSGTTAGKADLMISSSGSAAASPVSIDVSNSATVDPLGGPVVLARIKAIVIQNLSTTDGHNLLLDATVSNACKTMFNGIATSKLVILPGGFVVLAGFGATGYAVTAATGDIISLDPGANTIPYAIDIIGASA
jgi:hypothetical protein